MIRLEKDKLVKKGFSLVCKVPWLWIPYSTFSSVLSTRKVVFMTDLTSRTTSSIRHTVLNQSHQVLAQQNSQKEGDTQPPRVLLRF